MRLADMIPILSVRNLSTGYGKKQVLFSVNLDVMPSETLLISGGNGSGKSTLLKAIYGLLSPWNTDAEVSFCPDRAGPTLSTQRPAFNLQNGLAYLPQKNAVFDELTVEDNLRLAGYTLGDHFASRRDEVFATLPAVQPMLRRKPSKMSGGERQMLALAMVLLHQPKLLLLDEPFSGLDQQASQQITRILADLSTRPQMSLIVVEHRRLDLPALRYRKVELRLGRILEDKAVPS